MKLRKIKVQPRDDRLGDLLRSEYELLAVYNAEKARGIVHTEAWNLRMAEIQRVLRSK